MRVAIIDLGTNSVRFDVHQFGPGPRHKALHREKIMVRLGQGVFLRNRLDRNAVQRTLHAFIRFKELSEQLRADRVIAFGTSALREVTDRDRFIAQIKAQSGIDLRVISGAEEAKLIARGVLANEKKVRSLKETFGLIDIGGGSTEITLVRKGELIHSYSFPLGTARLQQIFLKQSPPKASSIVDLRHYIRNILLQVTVPGRWPKVDQVIGSSGTIKALARILNKKNIETIAADDLSELVTSMGGMTTTELLEISGMESKRVDMILAGAVLLDECMDVLGAKKVDPTDYSLRDGILDEELQLIQRGTDSHLALHQDELYAKAVQFGQNREHLESVVQLGGLLFKKLKPIHRLGPEWAVHLSAALILRNVGEFISLAEHEVHSKYIVEHTDLPPMEDWEVGLIASLCRYHENVKVDASELGKPNRQIFLTLLSLLRLVDSLDSGPGTRAKVSSLRIDRKRIQIVLSGRKVSGLEALNVELKCGLFEKTLKRKVSVTYSSAVPR